MSKSELPFSVKPNAEPNQLAGGLTRREIVRGINAGLLALGAATVLPARSLAETAANAGLRTGPHKVREIENVWITMRDGTKIAARIWLPANVDQNPVPALLEYLPYRLRDGTRLHDESFFAFYASHGYAGVRADIRGSGDSEGLTMDEYLPLEQEDGLEIIAWMAKQPWCNGKVGMFGKSWSGFNSLQLAALRPPALKAIITHCSTDDRYTDDAHYSGGTINECMFVWGSIHTTNTSQPPDPEIVGPRWREMWRERLAALDFYVGNWLSHQHRDAFWKHASIDEDWGAIQCPVYAVGGWVDPFSSTVSRMLANLRVPRKGLIGPWSHNYPNYSFEGAPGPAIDWMNESLRWWDHWLKGIDTGIMKEPMFRVWMQNETAFQYMTQIPGRWVAEDEWPSHRIRVLRFHLNDTGLDSRGRSETVRNLTPLQTVGITAPYWYMTLPMDLPGDQRIDDARSLTFDSAVLQEPMEMLGAAVTYLELAVDKPVAFLMVRLNELTPDGVSRRVTYGILNLCERDSQESPKPLEPGKRYRIRLQIRDFAHVFKRGSRIRLAVSTTSWPIIWPSPEAVTLTLYTGASTLELPVRPTRAEDAKLAPFGPAFVPENSGTAQLVKPAPRTKNYDWDVRNGTLTIRTEQQYERSRFNSIGTETYGSWREVSQIRDGDPTSAKIEHSRMQGYYRPGWDVRVETVLRMSVTKDTLLLTGEVNTFDDGKPFYSRKWERPITRNLI